MGRILIVILIALSMSGCAKINPRMDQKLDNTNGKIDEIKNNQNGIMLDLLKLKQQAEFNNSQIKEFQQGMVNLNAAFSKNDNSGIQILQGDGALILVFGLAVIGMLLFYFHDKAAQAQKTAEIMAQEIARLDNPQLEENILRAALHTDAEKNVYHMLIKAKRK